MPKVVVPNTPLMESDGSFGHHVETPRIRASSEGSFGRHVEAAPIPMSSTVNGVTTIVPADPRK
ncbi:hypothetical protein BwSF12_47220 [Bradyrhizobium ottawaense]|uniref:hypothetical protein n=1 Tax=Bradyrhizobium ottawaense TaxID=931866 RepID=UPI0027D6D1FF|nr:hypothetical protein BwSH14_43700 [Bradyrhizobium ottawaense]GMO43334.1 hypothetical protein BwSF12_47220 [Bradyrhizobium ottawaense]GMO77738.1 hypothetical protein BwSF19_25040 [Bradyrhizobium ottawaense]GMO87628.1 hypothetical protein BwSH17_72270 [Bradyrhizobium ottawaense]